MFPALWHGFTTIASSTLEQRSGAKPRRLRAIESRNVTAVVPFESFNGRGAPCARDLVRYLLHFRRKRRGEHRDMPSNSTFSTVASVAGGVVATALVIWPLAVWFEVRKCEKPKYKQLLALGTKLRSFYDRYPALEIREYQPYVVAEVTVEEHSMREAVSKGFRQIAGFIFGGNVKNANVAMTSPVISEFSEQEAEGEKIAMTSPVTTEIEGNRYKIAFVMPSKYVSKDDLPQPKNASVQLTNVPAHTLAALSWRGWPTPTEAVVKEKEAELRSSLRAAGIQVEDGAKTRLYQYYPPFAPQPIRLQDVLLPVNKNSLTEAAAKQKAT